MSNKSKKNNNRPKPKQGKRHVMTAEEAKEKKKQMRTDPYWNDPLWYRIYMRVLYAFLGFIFTVCFFSQFTGWNTAMQCVFGGLVAICILLWRQAFPNGIPFWDWFMEGMSQGLSEKQKANLQQQPRSLEELQAAYAQLKELSKEQSKQSKNSKKHK